jgi:hypothetical protein
MPATFQLLARLALLAVLALGWRFAMSPAPLPDAVIATGWDRLHHFYAFAVLGFCATALWPKQARHLMIFIGMYAVVIALLQSSIPGAARDWELLLSNLIAGFVGWLGAEPFRRRRGL